jgi:two-component system, OmpR family, KDP operon response regulator KdpE
VDATRSAAEALDRAALRLPRAAIIELVLPDGDGVEVCQRLREWSAMPVILLSAVCDEELQVRAFEAGADDYVTKPFRPRELVARLLANLRPPSPKASHPSRWTVSKSNSRRAQCAATVTRSASHRLSSSSLGC